MSFDSNLKDLINNVESSLQDLENLLQKSSEKSQGNLDASNREVQPENLYLKMKETWIRASHLLKQMETSYSDNQLKISQLGEELKIHIESLERDAVNHFNKGEYQECQGVLSFLSVIKPNDPKLGEYRELCQRKIAEGNDVSAIRLVEENSMDHGQNPLESLVTNGTSAESKQTEPSSAELLSEDSTPDSLAFDLEENGPINSESLVAISPQSGLSGVEMELRMNSQPRRFLNMNWTIGLIALLAFALLLFAVYVRRRSMFIHENSSGYPNPHSTNLAKKGPERASPSLNTLQAENHEFSTEKDTHSPVNQRPVGVQPTDQATLEKTETAQALFDVGRLQDAITICNAILIEDPKNEFALMLRKSVQDSNSHHAKIPSLKGSSDKTRIDLHQPDQAGIQKAQQNPQLREPPQLVGIPIRVTNGSHGESEQPFEANAAKQQNLVISWVQEAQSAMISGRYVMPPQDNVLVYCRRALAIDPQNTQAMLLKKESFVRAVSQAKEWTNRGKYDEARQLYSSLCYLSEQEDGFPYSVQELKQELDKLEFKAYPVIHQHTIGSCTGRLRMNGYVVSFTPTAPSEEGFTERLTKVNVAATDDKLKLKVGDKTYRFRANTGEDIEERQKNLGNIYGQLILLLSKAN